MNYTPYPCQGVAIKHALNFLQNAGPEDRQLYSAPTGVGKSIIELLVKEQLPGTYIVTPREEIVDGMLDKIDAPSDASGEDYGIWTPIRLRNMLLKGEVEPPKYVIFDETHHHEANSWKQLDLLTGLAPSVGYTASPYRGTPKSTAKFLETWGEPLTIITYQEAADLGYIRIPSMSILPLVDDDYVDVNGNEFNVTSLEAATVDRLGDLAEHSRQWYDGTKWDLPTIYAVPGTGSAEKLHYELSQRGLPCAVVSSRHRRAERPAIFDAVEASLLALIHVNVVQEGVDLKLRRLVDASPCMSPVKWVQQIGRIMRPWHSVPEYVCCNRNVLRHAYILDGIVPPRAIQDTETFFGASQRAHSRVLGLENIGRFKPTSVKLLNGCRLYVYTISALVQGIAVHYCCLVHPTVEPVWAVKVNLSKDGIKTYGNWQQCEAPQDIRGFSSASPKAPTEKQLGWWKKSAKAFGLDPEQEMSKKSFEVLPVLKDLGVRYRD